MAEDAWQEKCLVTISKEGEGDVTFQALTETVDIDVGEKDNEGMPLVNGGRVNKITPETDTSITLEAYPLQAGTTATADDTAGTGFFDLLHTSDASQPIAITNSHTRNKYRIAILWTSDTSVTNAADTTTVGYEAYRFTAARGHFTSVKESFTDGIKKTTIVYKTPAFDKSANSNIKEESTDTSIALPALNAYTSSTAF